MQTYLGFVALFSRMFSCRVQPSFISISNMSSSGFPNFDVDPEKRHRNMLIADAELDILINYFYEKDWEVLAEDYDLVFAYNDNLREQPDPIKIKLRDGIDPNSIVTSVRDFFSKYELEAKPRFAINLDQTRTLAEKLMDDGFFRDRARTFCASGAAANDYMRPYVNSEMSGAFINFPDLWHLRGYKHLELLCEKFPYAVSTDKIQSDTGHQWECLQAMLENSSYSEFGFDYAMLQIRGPIFFRPNGSDTYECATYGDIRDPEFGIEERRIGMPSGTTLVAPGNKKSFGGGQAADMHFCFGLPTSKDERYWVEFAKFQNKDFANVNNGDDMATLFRSEKHALEFCDFLKEKMTDPTYPSTPMAYEPGKFSGFVIRERKEGTPHVFQDSSTRFAKLFVNEREFPAILLLLLDSFGRASPTQKEAMSRMLGEKSRWKFKTFIQKLSSISSDGTILGQLLASDRRLPNRFGFAEGQSTGLDVYRRDVENFPELEEILQRTYLEVFGVSLDNVVGELLPLVTTILQQRLNRQNALDRNDLTPEDIELLETDGTVLQWKRDLNDPEYRSKVHQEILDLFITSVSPNEVAGLRQGFSCLPDEDVNDRETWSVDQILDRMNELKLKIKKMGRNTYE